jgi:predicted transcriptional regulator of viral defense system
MKPLFLSLPKHPFDYNLLLNLLANYRSPRMKIGSMLKNQEIIRVKKGLYLLSPEYGGEMDKQILSNLIYGPSYVSLEYALSYWGLIPERVEEITAITNKRNKKYATPIGNFSYHYISGPVFSIGRVLVEGGSGSFIMASKEKAICDKIAKDKRIHSIQDVNEYLEKDLRFDWNELKSFNIELLNQIQTHYRKRSVTAFFQWVKETSIFNGREAYG